MNRLDRFQLGLTRPNPRTTLLVIALLGGWAASAPAYQQFSQGGGDNTNCGACHGDFRAGIYISPTDGMNWGNLHNLHRTTMLNGDCDTCHSGADRFPVRLSVSAGGDGLDPLACVGCHGRAEDHVAENPEVAAGRSGYGAGLRQHHFRAGETLCTDCHLDANPAGYTPVGEEIRPPYYANPGSGHPAMPTQPCNLDGNENFAGIPEGLDNDGDDVYDGNDGDCSPSSVPGASDAAEVRFSNRPNPFSGVTTIEFEVAVPASVELRILDVHGRKVRHLVLGMASGPQRIEWDGRDDQGRRVASGIYRCEVRMGGESSRRTMILLH